MSVPRVIEVLCCTADGCGWTVVSTDERGDRRPWCGHIGTGRKIKFVNAESRPVVGEDNELYHAQRKRVIWGRASVQEADEFIAMLERGIT